MADYHSAEGQIVLLMVSVFVVITVTQISLRWIHNLARMLSD